MAADDTDSGPGPLKKQIQVYFFPDFSTNSSIALTTHTLKRKEEEEEKQQKEKQKKKEEEGKREEEEL